MNNTSNRPRAAQEAQKVGPAVFSDLYEENKSKIVANSAQLLSPEQLKAIYEKAYKTGYLKGEKQAKENVMTVVHEELAEMKQTLRNLAVGFRGAIDHHADRVSEDLLALALELSKVMLQQELKVNREAVLPVIRHALSKLPSLQVPIKLSVHPEDLSLVSGYMPEVFEGVCQVIPDPAIERGGCILDSDANSIDASNVTRWNLLCQSLGYEDHRMSEGQNAD